MKILFVHQNFPGQFGALAAQLAADPNNEVVALRSPPGIRIPGVKVVPYTYMSQPLENQHRVLIEQESKLIRAEAAAEKAKELKKKGFSPDVIIAHSGWGEAIFLKDVWPNARLIGYMEYFYRDKGQDIGFDPEFLVDDELHLRLLRWKNAANFFMLEQADALVSPTEWQRATYPKCYQDKIQVIHDGIDTDFFKPDPKATLTLAKSKKVLTANDEVITYVARYLEPIRGFHTFMRALPAMQKARPKAHFLILGGDDPGYMNLPQGYPSYKRMMLEELHRDLDASRVHFMGVLDRENYRSVLQISSAHIYLTYPFVLSWSLLEAMSCGVRLFASNTAPVTEYVAHEKQGVLFDFSTESLVDTVLPRLAARKKDTGLRRNARESVLGISRNKMLSRWCDLITQ